MNMFEMQERLKDFSKDQLVQEMQMPSGTAPPFLVLTELQRRTRMEQAMKADGQGAPQSTVAEDAVASAGVPQGGLQQMAQALAPRTDMAQNDSTAPVAAMQEGGMVESNAAQVQSVIDQVMGGGAASPMVPQMMSYAQRAAQLPQMAPPMQSTPTMPVAPVPAVPDVSGMGMSDLSNLIQTAPDLATRQAALTAMRVGPEDKASDSSRRKPDENYTMSKAKGGVIRYQEGGSIDMLLRKEQASPEDMTEDEWRTLYGSNWSIMRNLAISKKNERGPEEDSGAQSGLDRLEAELEAADNPRQRARRLSEIGANVDDFIKYSGMAALRQGDALLGAGTTLGARAGEAALGGLSAASSFLGAPGLGETLENVAGDVRQGREYISQGSGEYMPFGLEGPQLLTRGMTSPSFELPPEATALYSQAEAQERAEGLPEGSDVFAEGSIEEALPGGYDLLPGSKGPSPRGSAVSEIEDFVAAPGKLGAPLGYGLGPSGADVAPSYESGPDGRFLQIGSPTSGGPRPLQPYDVSTGIPVGTGEMEARTMPTQEDFDNTYRLRMSQPDRFPGEDRVAFERQAAAERRVPLEAFGGTGGGYKLPEPETLGEQFAATYLDTLMMPVFGGLNAAGDYIAQFSQNDGADGAENMTTGEPLDIPEDVSDLLAPPAKPDSDETPRKRTPTGPSGPIGGGPSGGGMPGTTGVPANAEMSENERMFNQDKWLALARVGLGLMASQAPTFGQALGEAGMAGVDALSSAREDYLERKQAEELMALRRAAMSARGAGGGGGGAMPELTPTLSAGEARALEVGEKRIADLELELLNLGDDPGSGLLGFLGFGGPNEDWEKQRNEIKRELTLARAARDATLQRLEIAALGGSFARSPENRDEVNYDISGEG